MKKPFKMIQQKIPFMSVGASVLDMIEQNSNTVALGNGVVVTDTDNLIFLRDTGDIKEAQDIIKSLPRGYDGLVYLTC